MWIKSNIIIAKHVNTNHVLVLQFSGGMIGIIHFIQNFPAIIYFLFLKYILFYKILKNLNKKNILEEIETPINFTRYTIVWIYIFNFLGWL